MIRKLWNKLIRLFRWCLPLGVYVWLYKRKDPDKYDFIWKDGDYQVIIYNCKVYGVWYQPKRLNLLESEVNETSDVQTRYGCAGQNVR